jgi:hypothetical protein
MARGPRYPRWHILYKMTNSFWIKLTIIIMFSFAIFLAIRSGIKERERMQMFQKLKEIV